MSMQGIRACNQDKKKCSMPCDPAVEDCGDEDEI